jgi:hypothetical protein
MPDHAAAARTCQKHSLFSPDSDRMAPVDTCFPGVNAVALALAASGTAHSRCVLVPRCISSVPSTSSLQPRLHPSQIRDSYQHSERPHLHYSENQQRICIDVRGEWLSRRSSEANIHASLIGILHSSCARRRHYTDNHTPPTHEFVD